MLLSEFCSGGAFVDEGGNLWRCTDKGGSCVVAIQLDHEDDPSWYNGPPYAVTEELFAQERLPGCHPAPSHDLVVEAVAADAEGEADTVSYRCPFTGRIIEVERREDSDRGGLPFEAFVPGLSFFMGYDAWVCTDKGARVVVARRLRDSHESVLDEYDLESCSDTAPDADGISDASSCTATDTSSEAVEEVDDAVDEGE